MEAVPSASNRSGTVPGPRLRDRVGDVDDDHEVGLDTGGRRPIHGYHRVHAETPDDPLIDERRRKVSVAHDPFPPYEGRRDLLRNVLRAIRRHEERLGRGCDRLAVMQQQLAR